MKINMPVTQREVSLKDNITIVSKTDLKGRITFINRDFMDVSGFAEDELIGEGQNIVRHPDMPAEAFEDLWATIKRLGSSPMRGATKGVASKSTSSPVRLVTARQVPIRQVKAVVKSGVSDADWEEF